MPSEIDEIFGKAGSSWTDDEYNRVWEWLYEYPQLRRLLLLAKYWLGSRATIEDAEEVWGKFNLYPSSRSEGKWIFTFRRVVNSYDPEFENARSFWNYLLFCFKNCCIKEGKRSRKDTTPLPCEETEDGEIIEIEIQDDDPDNNPPKVLEREEFRREIERCLQTLKPRHRNVFELCDLDGHTHEEAAEILNVPVGSIKGWGHRARQKLKECLKEGWSHENSQN